MEVNFITKDLLAKLSIVAKVVTTSKISKYDAITIFTVDNATWLYGRNSTVEVYAKVGAKIIEPGQLSILGGYLWNTIKTYPKEALVKFKNNEVACENYTNVMGTVDVPLVTLPDITGSTKTTDLLTNVGLLAWADRLFYDQGYLVGRDSAGTQIGILKDFELTGSNYLATNLVGLLTNFKLDCQFKLNTDNLIVIKDDFIIVGAITPIDKIPPYKSLLPNDSLPNFNPVPELVNALQNANNTTGGKPVHLTYNNNAVRIIGNNPDIGNLDVTFDTKTKGDGNMRILANQFLSGFSRANNTIFSNDRAVILSNGKNYFEVIAQAMKHY